MKPFLILFLIGFFVPILTAGHIFGRVTHFGYVVVHLADLTAQITWIFTVQADIELLAISWMRKFGMDNILAVVILLGLILGAGKAAGGFF